MVASLQKTQAGYRKTDVGVIPKDWEVKFLAELFTFSGGFTASREELSDEGLCYLHYGDIHKSTKTYIDVSVNYFEIPKLNIPINRVSKSSLLNDGDIVFVDASEDDEGASRHIVVRNPKNIIYISGLHTIVSKSKNESLDNTYKQYCFQTRDVKRQFKFYAVGTKVTGISKTNIERIQIPIPPKPEQKAIANSLNDVDTFISRLEEVIVKKENIKQGTMQELLTGKKRLPGFSGKWEVKKLGDVCGKITTGKLDANAMVKNGEFRFYTCAKEYYWIDKYAFDTEALLVSGNGANVGYIHHYKGKFNAYQRTYVLSNFFEDIMFIKLFMDKNLQERIRVEVNAGNTPYITMGTLTEMQVLVPPNKEEQIAIAQILSDMDAEIDQLQQKLDKYKMIKQGMMQELLTGKKRLI